MRPFTRFTAKAVPLPAANVDTDQILPARFLKMPREGGYDRFLFHDLRTREDDGSPRPPFPMDDPDRQGAEILVARANFGCGSSREGAVYALVDAGFRAVLAPSFGDIFYSNALKNGLLAVVLPEAEVETALADLTADPAASVTVDLAAQEVHLPDGSVSGFAIDPFRKACLLQGVEEIGLTLDYLPEIEAFERRRVAAAPWAILPGDHP